jgi:T-complex protein 1 subunit beta
MGIFIHLISSPGNWQSSFVGGMAIADLAKSTLGPKGMVCPYEKICALFKRWQLFKYLIYVQDKILQSTGRGRSVTVTNDGATILKSLHIDNPAAKVLVGILLF